MKPSQQLIEEIAKYPRDPLGFVRRAYDWTFGELEDYPGPYEWQADILDTIGQHLRSSKRYNPLLISVASGHGIGKSALIAWIANWAMSTCDDCRCVVTANTESQLVTKTWPEITKWFKRAINAHWWNQTATRIMAKEAGHQDHWRLDRETWSENNTEAFAGLHNIGKRIVVIYDEASAIPPKIWEVTEGALTDENTEIIWLAFGNPTQNTGRFRECFGRFKHRWVTRQIDSRQVPGTNKTLINGWVKDYGEDSDFVRVRVRGEFPRAGSSQFIAGDVVAQARQRKVSVDPREWKVLTVDVARFGDNQTVIGLRQGYKLTILEKLRGQSVPQTAYRVMSHIEAEKPRMTVIDGDGIGGGVVDIVRERMEWWFKNWAPACLHEFHGGAAPRDGFMYFNYRAECWGLMRTWLETAEIPDDPELDADLTGPEYFYSSKNQIQLERKEDMMKRGLASPDSGDMLAMSFSAIPPSQTSEERLRDKILASSPMEAHLIRYAETLKMIERREPDQGYWLD
jgi:hypothetical protein